MTHQQCHHIDICHSSPALEVANAMASERFTPTEIVSIAEQLTVVGTPPVHLRLRQYFEVTVRASISSGDPVWGASVQIQVGDVTTTWH
jgi:hypothetical protein